MASSIPDPSTLTSSAQIFSSNHTLPQIRSIHRALHAQVEEKASRLRTQVGGSYRELLDTADTIVRMSGDNDRVQELLGSLGRRCGRAVVHAKAAGLAGFVAKQQDAEAGRAARLRLLSGCGLVAGRILKGQGGLGEEMTRGDRLLLAAKAWVLIRLLIKGLEEEGSSADATTKLESAVETRESLRRRLNGAIRRVLERAGDRTERADIVKVLCAHSLVASSGASDTLRYFLSVRGEATALALDPDQGERATTTEAVVRSLQLYTTTLLDVQALVPAKLSPALSSLKSRRLLADASLQRLEGLRLDVYEQWCSEEIQYFTPFIRHDDLDGQRAREMLASWASKGGQVLLRGLRGTLEHMVDLKSIVDLRTQLLRLWIRDGGKAKGLDPSAMLDDLRDEMTSRMLAVLESKVTKLRLVASEVGATLDGWQEGVTDKHPGLWDEAGYDEALDKGAAPFVQEVVARLYGRSDAVSRATHSYSSWLRVVDDVKDVVERLRRQRWDNDDDEIEDEETIRARQQALSNDDPNKLQERLDAALDQSFAELQEELCRLWQDKSEGPAQGAIAMYLVRVLRDIRAQLPDRPAARGFGLAMVPDLHGRLAVCVSAQPVDEFVAKVLPSRRMVGRVLWEGEPALPNQPSPGLFQFLRDVSLSMSDRGADVWSAAAMAVLKRHLCERLCESWRRELAGGPSEAAVVDGDDGDEDGVRDASPTAEQMRDVSIQWLFDVSYLGCCVGMVADRPSEALKKVEDEIYERTGLDEASRQRIANSAQGYWQRTSLLFGLLA